MAKSREAMRQKLLGGSVKPKSKFITVYGVEMELRQPTFGAILEARDQSDSKVQAATMIVRYAYVPGTDERLFDDSDVQTILSWPFGHDLLELQKALSELTGLNIADAEAELKKDPLPEQ